MDHGGYLPISLIASFHRVQALTQDVGLVIQALQQSPLLEVKDGVKVRTVDDPEKWPILPENGTPTNGSAGSASSSQAPSPVAEESQVVAQAEPQPETKGTKKSVDCSCERSLIIALLFLFVFSGFDSASSSSHRD